MRMLSKIIKNKHKKKTKAFKVWGGRKEGIVYLARGHKKRGVL